MDILINLLIEIFISLSGALV